MGEKGGGEITHRKKTLLFVDAKAKCKKSFSMFVSDEIEKITPENDNEASGKKNGLHFVILKGIS